MAWSSQSMLSANIRVIPSHKAGSRRFFKRKLILNPNTIRASSSNDEDDCNVEECAPDKEGSSGGGGGPASFLLKTYDQMLDDSSTDKIVSSSTKNSFVIWSSLEFARLLLPTYFKHNNFSSFIRQLNLRRA